MKIGARVGSIVVLAGLAAACMSMRGPETGGDMSRGFDGAIGRHSGLERSVFRIVQKDQLEAIEPEQTQTPLDGAFHLRPAEVAVA